MRRILLAVALFALVPVLAQGQAWDLAKKAGGAATGKLEGEINKRLLEEGRKNQCSFKSGTADLEPGCDAKSTKLAKELIDAKKKLTNAGVKNFKFVVSGHTDSSGDEANNKKLSEERAGVMVKQLVAKGVPPAEIEAVGMGSSKPIEKPDDTPAKKAKNRRYEVQVRL
jgi:OOP family OmpA-OmpF porin